MSALLTQRAELNAIQEPGTINVFHCTLFVLICLVVVVGTVLCCFRERSMGPPAAEARLRSPPLGSRLSYNQPHPPTRALVSTSLSFNEPYLAAAAFDGSPRSFGSARQPPVSPGGYPQGSSLEGPAAEAPSVLCPQLVTPTHARLAVPLNPLREALFEVDILGISGKSLLTAAVVQDMGGPKRLKVSFTDGALLAQVSSNLELFDAAGDFFGTLREEQASLPHDVLCRYQLSDRVGRPIMTFIVHRGGMKWTVNSTSGVERARVERKPPEKMPAEHYDVVTNPNVDAVLVMSCFLSLVIFELPHLTSTVPSALPSGGLSPERRLST